MVLAVRTIERWLGRLMERKREARQMQARDNEGRYRCQVKLKYEIGGAESTVGAAEVKGRCCVGGRRGKKGERGGRRS